MDRMYTVVVSGTASPAAAFDILEINGAAGKPVALQRMIITQTSEPTTEEEQLFVQVIKGFTTSGSGGSAPTPAPIDTNTSASGFAAEVMNTTVAVTGTTFTLIDLAFNSRAGLDLALAPNEQPMITGNASTERLVVRIGAPADAITFRATFWLREML
jgi:hypothetical protein